jgi:two-component system chemotaxis sensor kinase CheA
MTIDLAMFHQAFFEEAQEHLQNMESLLLEIDIDDPDPERFNALFRTAHSIKGSAGTFGFTDLQDVTHILENLLDRIRKGELPLRSEMVDVFLATADVLKEMLAAHRGAPAVDPAKIAAICQRLEQLTTSTESAQIDEGYGFFDSEPALETASIPETAYGFFNDPDLATPPPSAAAVDAEQAYGLFEEIAPPQVPSVPTVPVMTAQPITVTATVATKPANREPRPTPVASTDTSIRVGIDKVDQLINLVGELVITQAMLAQSVLGIDPVVFERLHTGLAQLERNTRDLQETVMSIRMVPMSVVFSRFPRVIRDLSQKLGKQIELKTSGESTELDKGLIERITDPLNHLIRNSLDHGIEMPAERTAKGKPASGTITLAAYQQSGNIVIEVGDDGAGLNRHKILDKARERGLAVHDGMSDHEVWQLIFEAGFSTADQITEVSGRGVGMDVVKRNITAMGGRVEIDSITGVGTRMTVRLPLTLAILDGMSVAAGNDTYIIPLGYVIESLQAEKSMIKSVSNVDRLIKVRGEYLPIIPLYETFGIPNAVTRLEQGIMVVVETDGIKAALFIDALVGQHQVVIKSLEANYRKVAGVAGATIMGDGHVALILDIPTLVELARQSMTLPKAA